MDSCSRRAELPFGRLPTTKEKLVPALKMTQIEKQLKSALGREQLKADARRSGFERRASRVLKPVMFITSPLHSLGTRRIESLADLHRDFNADHGTTVNYKPYYERLDTRGFAEWMRSTFEHLLSSLYVKVVSPLKSSPFGQFEDIVLHDGTSFALHEQLARSFPGRFTTISPSAVELHATMSLFHDNLTAVTVTPDSECERHYAPEAEELRGKLLLADRGYDGRPYMAAIDQQGGHFLIRIRGQLDPIVTKIHREGERYRKLEGRRLSRVLQTAPKGKVLDMDVQWPGKSGAGKYCFRLVTKYNGADKGWLRLMSNLPHGKFTTSEVLNGYRLRWQIELFFKELKSYANLHVFCTRKPFIAEGLFWASLCVAFLKRYVAHSCQHAFGVAISTRRVAMCSHTFLAGLFESMRNGFSDLRNVLAKVFRFLTTNARRSNLKREHEKGRLTVGLRLIFQSTGFRAAKSSAN
jgi:hypothetical protein